jgi:uncharacterized Zn-finger protein
MKVMGSNLSYLLKSFVLYHKSNRHLNSCQYPFINYLGHTQGFFMKHFKKHHGGFPPGFEDAKIYICDQCPEEFLTPYNLANHKSSVHKFLSQKFICDKCDTG